MSSAIGNRGLNGTTILPYASYNLYAGSDAFMDLEFVDHTLTPVIPTSFTWQMDDLTNDVSMIGQSTTTTLTSASLTLQIPGSQMVMTYPYIGSQLCQFSFTMIAIDSVTGNPFSASGVVCIQLIAIQTPNGL
jgi:hypothetical protein